MHGLAHRITRVFCDGQFRIVRLNAPRPGWDGMPEVEVTNRLRDSGVEDVAIRYFHTFTMAMDRARDADALWRASAGLFKIEPWVYQPKEVATRPFRCLQELLKEHKVSQRHGTDSTAWRAIGRTLSNSSTAPAVSRAIVEARGDARDLLSELDRESAGVPLFPLLRGPKIGPVWVRILAYPGGAHISSLGAIPVAVDVHVRRVTEYLGVSCTHGKKLEDVRETIQRLCAEDVRRHGAEGPGLLADTYSAVDPALWFLGKWGCSHCEDRRRRIPVADICGGCRFDQLNPGGAVRKASARGCRR